MYTVLRDILFLWGGSGGLVELKRHPVPWHWHCSSPASWSAQSLQVGEWLARLERERGRSCRKGDYCPDRTRSWAQGRASWRRISEGEAGAREESRERARGRWAGTTHPHPQISVSWLTRLIRFFLKEIVSGETQTSFAKQGKFL